MNPLLPQVREAVIRAVPEIKKLQFGCIAAGFYASEDNPDKYYYIVNPAQKNKGVSVKSGRTVNYVTHQPNNGKSAIEIHGRPIRLFDIKQCLEYNGYTISDFASIASLWKGEDNLDKQDQKLIAELYEKLKDKNVEARNVPQ